MLFSGITILDEAFQPKLNQWVGISGAFIDYVGPEPTQEQKARYKRIIDGAGKLLMPGLYNTHSHAAMTLLRGYAEDLPLYNWLFDKVLPFENHLAPGDVYWATQLACAEMLRFGTVGFSDMYLHAEQAASAIFRSGMKASLCDTSIDHSQLQDLDDKDYLAVISENGFGTSFHVFFGDTDNRMKLDVCIHAEYTTTSKQVRLLAQMAAEEDRAIQVHVSETKQEHEACKERHGGLTPVQYLDSLGVFDVPCTAAHCVWVEDEDIQILADKGVHVALNPASNMKLGSGFAPVGKLLDAGVSLCLGTDGCASNNNLNMFQDLYLLSMIYKGHEHNPRLVSAAQALHMATRAGALAQGRQDAGCIAPGMRADIIMLDATGPQFCPSHKLVSDVVYAAQGSDVVMTVVDGQVLYEAGSFTTIDIEQARHEVFAASQRISSLLQ